MPQSEIARKTLHPMNSTEWQLPASRDTLARILDLVEDAIISVDREQQIVLYNQAAEQVFGYAASEVRGKTLDALLPYGFVQDRGAHVVEFPRSPQASRPMPVRHEIVARRKNGEEFPAEASISEFQTEDGWMLTVILRDITRGDCNSRSLSGEPESGMSDGPATRTPVPIPTLIHGARGGCRHTDSS